MKKTRCCIYLLMLILGVSCNHVYKEYDKESFSTFSWNDGQEISFYPRIKDINKTYEVSLGLRHHYRLNLAMFKVNIKIVAPSGIETSKDYTLHIKDSSDKNIGSCAGDMCDLETVILDDLKFEEIGEYKILVSHNERGHRIPGVLEVGLIIDEKD